METPKIATTWTSGHPRLKQSLKRPPLCGLGSDERPEGLSGRVLPPNAPVMHQSIEEDEVTAQRDAAVSLFKGLQERVCRHIRSNDNLAAFCGVVLLCWSAAALLLQCAAVVALLLCTSAAVSLFSCVLCWTRKDLTAVASRSGLCT